MIASLNFPALHASHSAIWFAHPGEPAVRISKGEAISRAAETPLIMLNAPLVAQRLGYPELSGLDLLELFAFIHPAQFMVPTPMGLAKALQLPLPFRGEGRGGGQSPTLDLQSPLPTLSPEGQRADSPLPESAIPALLHAAAEALIATLERPDWPQREGAWTGLQALARLRWP